jgi:hypothetical protein
MAITPKSTTRDDDYEAPKAGKAPAAKAETTDEDIQKAVDGVVKGFKGKADRAQVVAALRTAAELLNRDDTFNAPAEEK